MLGTYAKKFGITATSANVLFFEKTDVFIAALPDIEGYQILEELGEGGSLSCSRLGVKIKKI